MHNEDGDRIKHIESKERLGDRLLLARLLGNTDQRGLFGEIVGIPFEQYQLEPIRIQVGSHQMGLLEVMSDMDLIGTTKGVPHLSVGGYTTQESGWVKKERRTSLLDVDATRAYLVNGGLGVQGMGLVKYENRRNNDFGLGMPFVRNSGAMDIGGGVDATMARFSEVYANENWMRSAVYFGAPRFARTYGVYPYQTWMKAERGETMEDAGLVIREDGRRNIPRKVFQDAILRLMPFVADEMFIPTSSFEIDGHNAFMRDGEVIFTDFESHDSMSLDYVSFMHSLANEWYFDEFRRNFSGFCNIFGFSKTGELRESDIGVITEEVHNKVVQAHYRDDLMAPLFKHLIGEDRKAIERYAIAGLMASRACGRLQGTRMIRPFVENMIEDPQYERLTISDVYNYVVERPLEILGKQDNHLNERVQIVRDQVGRPNFEIELKTFGLPVEPTIRIPIDHSDILHVWPYEDERPKKLALPENLSNNPFIDVDPNIIANTVYSRLASGFADMVGLEAEKLPLDQDRLNHYEYVERNGAKKFLGDLAEGKLNVLQHVRVLCEGRDDVVVDLYPSEATFSIEMKRGAKVLPIAELNKLAYTIHTIIDWLNKNGISQREIDIVVSGIGK